jgi:hypothetical protein
MTRKLDRDGRPIEDEEDVLRDGETFRVPMMLRDGSTVDLEPWQADWVHASRLGLDDGLALHRPGPRYCTDQAGLDAKVQAYAEMVRDMCGAWKSPARPPAGSAADVIHEPSDAWKGNHEVARVHDTGDAVRDAYLDSVADLTTAWSRRR